MYRLEKPVERVLKKLSKLPWTSGLLAGCLGAVALLATVSAASAKTYRPTRTDDPVPNGCKAKDCSLREAVIASNAGYPTPSTILLRPGRRYVLTRPGLGEDAAVTGDLDLTTHLTVQTKGFVGAKKRHRGGRLAVIDGNDIDRVFDVRGTGLRLDWIVVRDGHARRSGGDDGDGGAIRGGFLKLHNNSRLVSNVAAGNGGAFATILSPAFFGLAGGMSMALLKGNTAAGNGGAVYVSGSPGRGLAMDRVRAETSAYLAFHRSS
jgi:predicted outer membrane repeat protein